MLSKNEKIVKILKDTMPILYVYNIIDCCIDDEAREKVKEIINKNSLNQFVADLDKYKDLLNMESLLLYSIRNEEDYLKQQESVLSREHSILYDKIKSSVRKQKEYFRGKKITDIFERVDLVSNKIQLDILDTDAIIEGIKNSKSKNYQRFTEFCDRIKKIEDESYTGDVIFFSIIPIKELINIYSDKAFCHPAYTYSIDKAIMFDLKKSALELRSIRKNGYKFNDTLSKDEQVLYKKKILERVIETTGELKKYADFDKIVVSGAYYLEELLEKEKIDKDTAIVAKQIMEEILKYCEESRISDKYKFTTIKDVESWEEDETISYSPKQMKEFLKRFINGTYIRKKDLDLLRQNVNNNDLYLYEIQQDVLSLLYKNEELRELLFSNKENFKFVKDKLHMDDKEILNIANKKGLNNNFVLNTLVEEGIIHPKDIISLYVQGKIEEAVVREVIQVVDINELIDFQQLKEEYEKSSISDTQKEEYKKYLEFYKIIAQCYDEQKDSEDSVSPFSEKFMMDFAANYDDDKREEYIDQLENFYKEGLLDIKSIISWEDDSIVAQFLKDGVINYNQLIKMQEEEKQNNDKGVISDEYFLKLYAQCILSPDFDHAKMMQELKGKLKFPDEYIARAYIDDILSTEEIDELIKLGKVDKNHPLIKEKKHEEFLEILGTVFDIEDDELSVIDMSSATKIKGKCRNNIIIDPINNHIHNSDVKTMIDPDIREEYFGLFKAVDYTDRVKIKEGSDFYNYKFYVLPDEDGRLGENSIIIAERYYMDKHSQDRYATQNATYFFRCKDFIEEMTKRNMYTQESKAVFRANHKLADDKKVGSWGRTVYYNIARIMLADSIGKMKPKEERMALEEKLREMYSQDELKKIQTMRDEIDLGTYNCEFIDVDEMNR